MAQPGVHLEKVLAFIARLDQFATTLEDDERRWLWAIVVTAGAGSYDEVQGYGGTTAQQHQDAHQLALSRQAQQLSAAVLIGRQGDRLGSVGKWFGGDSGTGDFASKFKLR